MAFFAKVLMLMALAMNLKATKTYTNRWDNLNVEEILASDRLLENYKKCLMDQGPCTPEGQELKRNLPDALQNSCTRCTDKQKENTNKVIEFMIENKKIWWEELQKKYDPYGYYYERRLARLQKEQEKNKNTETSTQECKESSEEEEEEDEEEDEVEAKGIKHLIR